METKECSVEGCNAKVKVRGMCMKHYQIWRYYDNEVEEGRSCKLEGCTRRVVAKGLCGIHYSRYKYTDGSLSEEEKLESIQVRYNKKYRRKSGKSGKTCQVEACSNTSTGSGYCRMHNRQLKVHQKITNAVPLDPTERARNPMNWENGVRRSCKVEGCKGHAQVLGMCNSHYRTTYRWDTDRDKCHVEGCDRATEARGLCPNHYQAYLRDRKKKE